MRPDCVYSRVVFSRVHDFVFSSNEPAGFQPSAQTLWDAGQEGDKE